MNLELNILNLSGEVEDKWLHADSDFGKHVVGVIKDSTIVLGGKEYRATKTIFDFDSSLIKVYIVEC